MAAKTNMVVELEQEARPKVPEKREFRVTPETANLIAAVGNSEAKAITLGSMQEGIIYTEGNLYRRVMGLQVGKEGWRMTRNTPFDYCRASLAPIGLVTHEVIGQYLETWGYRITPYGEEAGKALVGHLLKWSLDHPNFSLYKMFGFTASTSKPLKLQGETGEHKRRAPEMRLRIFCALATNPSGILREVDLGRELGEDHSFLQPHLAELSRNGVIGYESIEPGKPYALYKLNGMVPNVGPEPVHGQRALTQEVYRLLKGRPKVYFSIDEVLRSITGEYPDRYEAKKLRDRLPEIMSGLERQGLFVHENFRYSMRSRIIISEEQGEVMVSLIKIVDRFQSKDPQFIQEGKRLTRDILADPEKAAELLLKAKENSPFVVSPPRLETASFITSILQESPQLTRKGIQERLGGVAYGIRLSQSGLKGLLHHLRQQGQITAEKTKAGNVYSVPEGQLLRI